MITNVLDARLAPVSDLDDADEAVRSVARSMVRLLGVTVRAQFPDAAYLVLHRSTEDEEVYLVAVRNTDGMDLWDFPTETLARYKPLPSPVPPELAGLWGDLDPQRPDTMEVLAQRIDAALGIDFVPTSAMHPGEEDMDRTPLGIPLLDAGVPTPPITWPRFVDSAERLRAEGRALARLIADTLSHQFDRAAYLVLDEGDSRDFMGMQSIHDGDGRMLFEFGDDDTDLPSIVDSSPLVAAWGHLDPTHPGSISKAIQALYRLGFTFDWMPDGLPSDDAPSEVQCLLLSSAAQPSWWGLIDRALASETLVRPYSAPRPNS